MHYTRCSRTTAALELSVQVNQAGYRCRLPLAGSVPPLLGDTLGVLRAAAEHRPRCRRASAGCSRVRAASSRERVDMACNLAVQLAQARAIAIDGASVELVLEETTQVLLHSASHLPSAIALPFPPHLAWSGPAHAAHFRLLAPPGVAALWLHATPQGESELLMCEMLGLRSRCLLFPVPQRHGLGVATKVDAQGTALDTVRATAEGDGYQFMLNAHEITPATRWPLLTSLKRDS